jgi:SAM-dependent methyltransferase
MKLHLGCGRDVKQGYVNLDSVAGPGIDVVADLDQVGTKPLPFEDDSVDEFLGSHLLEHIREPLPLMQELHRIAKPGSHAVFNLPYGSSDDAWTDPTHRRPWFMDSFGYFSQPFYWRADYGYRGDWQPGYVLLRVEAEYAGRPPEEVMRDVRRLRNVVVEMTAVLTAVKPIRKPNRALQQPPQVEIVVAEEGTTAQQPG